MSAETEQPGVLRICMIAAKVRVRHDTPAQPVCLSVCLSLAHFFRLDVWFVMMNAGEQDGITK
jgi:hypothetical protein